MSERDRQQQAAIDAGRALPEQPPAAVSGSTINWRDLDDIAASVVWNALRSWVEWVTVRYAIPISVIPNCWSEHPALVEELSALYAAHQAAFDPKDNGYGPMTWHEHFASAQPRLTRAYGGGCTTGHKYDKPRPWIGVTDEQAWADWINTSHAH